MATVKATDRQDALTLPNGAVIDLAAFDWGEERLTKRQKLFVVWFCTPGTEYYHCPMKAARKAGYTDKTAHVAAHKMRRDPKIDKLVKKFDEAVGKVNIIDTVQRWIQEKIIRGDYDVEDFYELYEYQDAKTGELKQQILLKSLDTLTPEQRLCIDGIDVKGQKGVTVYTLPDRERIRDSLIALAQKQDMDKDDDGMDIETITEIIKGQVTVKTKIIDRNKAIMAQAAGFHKTSKETIAEES